MTRDPLDFRRHVLPTGMRVYHQHRPLQHAACRLMYHAGARMDPPGKAETMHILEHGVGVDIPGYPSKTLVQLQSWIESQGLDTMLGQTTLDATCYDGWAPKGRMADVLRLLHAMTQTPSLASTLRKEREIIRVEREDAALPKERRTVRIRAKTVFGDDPAVRSECWGEDADLNRITTRDIRDAHARWYHPANASLIFVGSIDEDEALRLAEAHFPDPGRTFVAGADPRPKEFSFRQETPYRQRMEAAKGGVRAAPANVVVQYTWYLPPANPAILRVAARKLHKRLLNFVREKLKLLYEVQLEVEHYPDFSLVFVGMKVSPGKIRKASDALHRELARLAAIRDIEDGRNDALRAYRFPNPDDETTLGLAGDDLESFGRIITFRERAEAVRNITAADVRHVYRHQLLPERAYVEHIEE